MGDLLLILVSTCLVNNLVFDHVLGVDPVLAASRETEPAADLGVLMILVMPWIALFSHALQNYLIAPLDLAYLQLLVLALLAPAVVLAAGGLASRFKPALHARIGPFIPLVIVNSTILGVALLNARIDYGPVGALFAGVGLAAGFAVALLALAAIREKISVADIPLPFQGVSILLITLGLISMAFMGFNGISVTG